MDKKIAIIGSGALATALGLVLLDMKFKNTIIYGVDQKELEELKQGHNSKYFPKTIELPRFQTTNDLEDAISDAKYIVLAVPSKVMDIVFEQVLSLLKSKAIIINGSKGFYPNTDLLLHSGLEKKSKGNKYIEGIVSIIGPSHAEEIVLKHPTLVTIVGKNDQVNQEVHRLFQTNYFKCYIQKDVIGAEVGAAYKNVLAIASGLATGIGYGINTRAAILSRGLLEMSRFNEAMRGNYKTIYGLTGLGDLIVTATSDLSRNFSYGKALVTLKDPQHPKFTVEGLVALEHIYKIGKMKNLDLPIAYGLYNVIFNGFKIETEIAKIWESKKIFE